MADSDPPRPLPDGCGKPTNIIMLLLVLLAVIVTAIWALGGNDTPSPVNSGVPPVRPGATAF